MLALRQALCGLPPKPANTLDPTIITAFLIQLNKPFLEVRLLREKRDHSPDRPEPRCEYGIEPIDQGNDKPVLIGIEHLLADDPQDTFRLNFQQTSSSPIVRACRQDEHGACRRPFAACNVEPLFVVLKMRPRTLAGPLEVSKLFGDFPFKVGLVKIFIDRR